MNRFLPFLAWWPSVGAHTLRADLLAGLVGAALVLPQGIAFATLAGMPVEYGLYCAMLPTAVAALFGSSLHAVSGPTNAVSLFVFAALSPIAAPGGAEYVSLALTLAFMSGLLMIALGVLRLGFLVNFMSNDVVVGFTAGVGVLIIVSQLGPFAGIPMPASGSALETLPAFVSRLGEARGWVLVVAGTTLASAVASRRWIPRLPYLIVSLATGSAAAWAIRQAVGEQASGIRTLAPLTSTLPPLSHPSFAPDTFSHLAGSAIALTLVSLTQAVSIARAIALRSGQRLDPNQEFIGQGLANVAASFTSGFPTSASVNRSGPNFESGARTPLAAVFAAVVLALVVLLLAPYARLLPTAAMAGSLMLVAWNLFDFARIRHALRTSREAAIVLGTSFAATLALRIEFAVLAGVMTSLVLYLHRTSRPSMRSLAPDPDHPTRKFDEVRDRLRECPQAKILRVEGSIYFGAVAHVEHHLRTLREVAPGQKHLLLMSKSINFVDLAGAELLAAEARRRRALGGRLYLYSPRQPAEDMLRRGGYLDEIGEDAVFRTKAGAIAGVVAGLDRAVCARCTARVFTECRALPGPGDGDSPAVRASQREAGMPGNPTRGAG